VLDSAGIIETVDELADHSEAVPLNALKLIRAQMDENTPIIDKMKLAL